MFEIKFDSAGRPSADPTESIFLSGAELVCLKRFLKDIYEYIPEKILHSDKKDMGFSIFQKIIGGLYE